MKQDKYSQELRRIEELGLSVSIETAWMKGVEDRLSHLEAQAAQSAPEPRPITLTEAVEMSKQTLLKVEAERSNAAAAEARMWTEPASPETACQHRPEPLGEQWLWCGDCGAVQRRTASGWVLPHNLHHPLPASSQTGA